MKICTTCGADNPSESDMCGVCGSPLFASAMVVAEDEPVEPVEAVESVETIKTIEAVEAVEPEAPTPEPAPPAVEAPHLSMPVEAGPFPSSLELGAASAELNPKPLDSADFPEVEPMVEEPSIMISTDLPEVDPEPIAVEAPESVQALDSVDMMEIGSPSADDVLAAMADSEDEPIAKEAPSPPPNPDAGVVAALLEETIAEEAAPDNPLVDHDDPLSLPGTSKLSEPVIPSELAPEAAEPKNSTTAIVLALVLAILILGTGAAIYVFFIAPQ